MKGLSRASIGILNADRIGFPYRTAKLQPSSETMTVLLLVVAGNILLAAAFSLVAVVAD